MNWQLNQIKKVPWVKQLHCPYSVILSFIIIIFFGVLDWVLISLRWQQCAHNAANNKNQMTERNFYCLIVSIILIYYAKKTDFITSTERMSFYIFKFYYQYFCVVVILCIKIHYSKFDVLAAVYTVRWIFQDKQDKSVKKRLIKWYTITQHLQQK